MAQKNPKIDRILVRGQSLRTHQRISSSFLIVYRKRIFNCRRCILCFKQKAKAVMDECRVKLSVYGILVDQTHKVLMQKRANTSYAEGWWSLPGGHVEPGESISAALRRELFEELGIEVDLDFCRFCLTLVRKPQGSHRYINFFYVVTKWSGEPRISDGKASHLEFFSCAAFPDPTLPYIKEAFHLWDKGVSFHESEY